MKLNHDENLVILLKAIRKRKKLGQVEVAKYLHLEQSAFSRIENGTQKLTASQWFRFCELTQTPADAAMFGFIDFLRPLGSQDRLDLPPLPSRYSFERGSSVRLNLPLINFAKKEWGKKKWVTYLAGKDLKPDFFLYLDNTININFEMDIAKDLAAKGNLDLTDLTSVFKATPGLASQGQLRFQYGGIPEPLERLKKMVENQNYYETDFSYSIVGESKSGVDIAVTPSSHLESFAYRKDAVLGDFLCSYRKGYLKNLSQVSDQSKETVALKEIGCHFKSAHRCTYRLTLEK